MAFCCKAGSYNDIYSQTAQLSGCAGEEKVGKNKWLVNHQFEPCEEKVRLVYDRYLDTVFHHFLVISLWKSSVLIWFHMYL